jgi:L-alanine-DL-glutamate epimerase-like enolase superfamily enzyme
MTIELYYREQSINRLHNRDCFYRENGFKMKELPWPIYKIKLVPNEDIAIVTELRKHTDAIFRIDANCGWGLRRQSMQLS